jgi:retron-type reverse transcriptase
MRSYPLKQRILKAIKETGNTEQKSGSFLKIPELINNLFLSIGNNSYGPSRFFCFAVKDPKIREIFAPDYKDRIIHHLIADTIQEPIDKKFIFDCYSNRKGKGIHMAIKRLRKFMRHKENQYYLMADIKTFFPSINKNILWKILFKHIESIKNIPPEEKRMALDLSRIIIFQDPIVPAPVFTGDKSLLSLVPKEKSLFHTSKNKGLPIGSLTSQFFANVYLNELDQYVKHRLKIKYYIRYVDDFVILAKDIEPLMLWQEEIRKFLKEKLDLNLHPKKTIIQHKSKGVNFLGYVVRENYVLVRKRTIKSLKRKLYFFNHLLDPEAFPYADPPATLKLSKLYEKKELVPPVTPDLAFLQKLLAVINSYYGILSFADSYKLRKNIYDEHFHRLKDYFLPGENYVSIKINPAFIKDGTPKI